MEHQALGTALRCACVPLDSLRQDAVPIACVPSQTTFRKGAETTADEAQVEYELCRKAEGRSVQWLSSCTVGMLAEDVICLIVYPQLQPSATTPRPVLLYISVHQLLPDSLAHWSPSKPCSSPQRTFPSQPAAVYLSL